MVDYVQKGLSPQAGDCLAWVKVKRCGKTMKDLQKFTLSKQEDARTCVQKRTNKLQQAITS